MYPIKGMATIYANDNSMTLYIWINSISQRPPRSAVLALFKESNGVEIWT